MNAFDARGLFEPGAVAFALRILLSVTVVWLIAVVASLALRRWPAALRHRVWALATAAVLLLPALLVVLPEWRVGVIELPKAQADVSGPPPGETSVLARDGVPRPAVSVAGGTVPLSDAAPSRGGRPAGAVPGRTAPLDRPAPVNDAAPVPATPWRTVAFIAWLVPTAWLLARQALAMAASAGLVRRATVVDATGAARLLALAQRLGLRRVPALGETSAVDSPLCLGCARACILLPTGWREWPAARLDAVLTHELAHVARRDVMWQTLARVARALYWFHPLAWVAAWRMRVERELACDDWVLRGGEPSTSYARCLLEIATMARARAGLAPVAGVAMAAPAGLESRVAAILDPHRRRFPVSRRLAAALVAAAVVLLGVMGTLSPFAADTAAKAAGQDAAAKTVRLEGRVENEKGEGAADVVVETVRGMEPKSTRTGPDGRFSFKVEAERFGTNPLKARTRDDLWQAYLPAGETQPKDGVIGGLKLVLKPARQFDVSVTDDKGAPVAGARVAASANYMIAGETTTDASGRSILRTPADAVPMFVLALKEGAGLDYVLFWRNDEPRTDPYRLDPGYAGPLAFVLNGAKKVTVRAVDEQGRSLEGVTVYPWLFDKPRKGDDLNLSGMSGFQKTTDKSGTVAFEVPADQKSSVTFWAHLKGYTTPQRPMWDPKTGAAEVEARLVKQVHVAGRVVDEQGKPAGGVRVRVAGDGYQFDSFRGETKSGDDGSFEIDVDPDQYYLFIADLADRVSLPQMRIIKKAAPAEPVQLALASATRVRGTVTAGPNRAPAASASLSVVSRDEEQSYLKLPEDQQFPGGVSGRKAIMPGASQHVKADDMGRFEVFVGPGLHQVHAYANGAQKSQSFQLSPDQTQYTLYHYPRERPGQRDQEKREVVGGAIDVNIHFDDAPDAGPSLLKGRVVLRDKPEVGVAEAKLDGDFVGKDDFFRDATSGKDGRFTVRHGKSDLFLSAVTADGKQRGIVVVKPGEKEGVEVPIGPMASAAGRLVDHEGKPLVGRSIQYGVEVGVPMGPTSTMFGAYVETDAEGKFTIREGLVPGFEYKLSVVLGYGDEGRPNSWKPVGSVKAERVERVDVGNLVLPAPYKPKTYKDYVASAFAGKRPLAERLAEARETARLSHQRVLVILGSAERPACQELYKAWHDFDKSDVWNALLEYAPVSVNADNADAPSRAWAEGAKIEWPKQGLTLAVLDADGRVVAQTREAALYSGSTFDRQKLISFAAAHAPAKPDAQKLLDEALAKAKREGKHVLLDESSPYCPPCVSLSKYLEANKALIEKDFVVVTLDRRFPNAGRILKDLRKDEVSTPWTAVLNADGKPLITSDGPNGNIGFPSESAGRAHWEKMVRTAAWRLTEPEIQELLRRIGGGG